jgi:hypothetical protein
MEHINLLHVLVVFVFNVFIYFINCVYYNIKDNRANIAEVS